MPADREHRERRPGRSSPRATETPRARDRWGNTSYAELHALAEKHGTPFFLYDADAINDRIKRLQSLFEHRIKVYYAVKANPNLALLRAVRDAADGLDISSGGELD